MLNTLAFIYTSLNGGFLNGNFAKEIGGISLESIRQHEYYRIISYAFLHVSVSHFTFNMFALIFFSLPIEKCLGSVKFIILFLATIIGTAFFTILVIFLMDYDFLSVGASGFGYGIFGVYIAIILFKKALIDKNSRTALFIFIGIAWLLTFTVGNVNIFGHMGGFISGIIVGSSFSGWMVFKKCNRIQIY